MRNKGVNLLVSAIFVCLLLGSNTSIAQDPPHQDNIPICPGLVYQPDISAAVLKMAESQFDTIIGKCDAIKGQSDLTPIEEEEYARVKSIILAKKNQLQYIDVYFIDEASGNRLDEVLNCYEREGMVLKDLVDKASQTVDADRKSALMQAFKAISPLSTAAIQQFEDLVDDFRAFGGSEGLSRISILSAFVGPNETNPDDFANPMIVERATVVIATSTPAP